MREGVASLLIGVEKLLGGWRYTGGLSNEKQYLRPFTEDKQPSS